MVHIPDITKSKPGLLQEKQSYSVAKVSKRSYLGEIADDFRICSDTFGRRVWCKIVPPLLTQNELKNPGHGGVEQKTLPSSSDPVCFDARLVFSLVSFQFQDHHFR